MTRRIVVRAGFHKTGTTSAQSFLAENGPVLRPAMALGMGYKFRRRFQSYLNGLNLGKRDLLISSEELSGHMPGRGDLADYSAAPILMRENKDVLKTTYPNCDLTFVFTLRKAETWWPRDTIVGFDAVRSKAENSVKTCRCKKGGPEGSDRIDRRVFAAEPVRFRPRRVERGENGFA